MKNKVIKIIAGLTAIVMLFSFAACGKEDEPATTTQKADDAVVTELVTNEDGEAVTDENGEVVTEAVEVETEENGEPASENDKTTKKTENKTTKKTENKTTKKETTTKKDSKPSTTAEILEYYKDALAKVNTSKAGYTKTRFTKEIDSELPAFGAKKIRKFMGLGDGNKYSVTVNKGTEGMKDKTAWNEFKEDKEKPTGRRYFISEPTLTASDIKSANCVESGDNYVITINIKDGNSKVVDNVVKNEWSPIDRAGICAGDRDMDIFDHKTAPMCMRALAYNFERPLAKDDKGKQIPNGDVVSVDEKSTNCKAVATINAKTGNLVSLKITFDLDYKIVRNGNNYSAKGETTIECKTFKW